MARSTRRAVKLVLFATVLAAAGAGVYHFNSGGGTAFWRLFANGELVADETAPSAPPELSQSDLDAVASAWAGAAPKKPAERSAEYDASAASYEEPSDANDERYSDGSVGDDDRRYPAVEPEPVDLPATDPREITRGQEPNDLGGGDALEQANPETLDDEVPSSSSSRRARAAFGDAAAAGDRYSAPGGKRQDNLLAAHGAQAAANPFASQAGPLPTTGPGDDFPAAAVPPMTPKKSIEFQPDEMRSASAAYRTAPGREANGSLRGAAESDPLSIQSDSFGTTGDGTGRPGERALEGPQKPALVIQKFAPPEIQVGKSAKFAVQVRNVGSQTADNVIIRDEVPHGTRVVNTTPRAEIDGNHLVWDMGALSSGEERTVEMELMPIAEGEIGSVATVSYLAQASAKTRCTMPQLAIRMTAPSQVMIGQEQRVKIELRNPGTGDATKVMLLENVPENVKHAAGPALEFEIGTLRAGETRELELVLTAERAGPVVNMLTARADGNLQVQQQVEFEVIAPDLQLTVDGPARRYLERPATYQVIVENPGTAPAHDIELVTKLPKGMQFVRANNMGEYDASTHSVYWSLAQLPEGEKGSVELVAMPVEPGQQTFRIEGKAQQGLTDEIEQDVLVEGLAAIMFEVRDAEDPIEVGGETSYEIRVVNQGSKAATNVQVVVNLPPGIEALSASGETRHTVQAGGVVFEPLAQLAPKTDSIYRVQVKGVQPGDQRVTVQVNTDDISQPIRREESTRVFGDE